MDMPQLYYRFGVALVIGILVGLQREHAYETPDREMFAGVRTFALMSLAGTTAAMVADRLQSPGIFLSILLLIGAYVGMAYWLAAVRGDIGLTTEVAALLTMLAGALCYLGELAIAVALAVTTTVLLSLKMQMQQLVRRLTREDIYATLKLAVITAIVLPVLPNRAPATVPFDVLNPYKIWLMVIFISGISFLGYGLNKVVGAHRGITLTGLFGGLASSTAVTLSFAQRSQKEARLAAPFAIAILLSWIMMFLRILVEVAALNRALLARLWIPVGLAGAAGLLYGLFLWLRRREAGDEDVRLTNPFELGPAIKFGLLYAVILVIGRTASLYFGNTGVYLSSIMAGIADVDAITLSMAELSRAGNGLDIAVAARSVVLAALSNTVVKGMMVVSLGSMELRRHFLPGFVLIFLVGVLGALVLI